MLNWNRVLFLFSRPLERSLPYKSKNMEYLTNAKIYQQSWINSLNIHYTCGMERVSTSNVCCHDYFSFCLCLASNAICPITTIGQIKLILSILIKPWSVEQIQWIAGKFLYLFNFKAFLHLISRRGNLLIKYKNALKLSKYKI